MFQSTRPRGARRPRMTRDELYDYRFNPRARVGRDRMVLVHRCSGGYVSIHAPAWGATSEIGDGRGALSGFNPRARVGRDFQVELTRCQRVPFQSTRPRGARHAVAAGTDYRSAVSIHAPAWGATAWRWPAGAGSSCFNPRARVGRDSLIITH